jgi:hypothetical protein
LRNSYSLKKQKLSRPNGTAGSPSQQSIEPILYIKIPNSRRKRRRNQSLIILFLFLCCPRTITLGKDQCQNLHGTDSRSFS